MNTNHRPNIEVEYTSPDAPFIIYCGSCKMRIGAALQKDKLGEAYTRAVVWHNCPEQAETENEENQQPFLPI